MNGNDDLQSNLTLRYILAGIALSSVTIGAIVIVSVLRPEHDNTAIITTIMAVSAGTYPTLATFIRGQANSEELRKAKRIQDERAEEVKRKLAEVNEAQRRHLEEQDAKLETVVRQTNGLIDEIKNKARKEGHESGEKAALKQLGIEPRRLSDNL